MARALAAAASTCTLEQLVVGLPPYISGQQMLKLRPLRRSRLSLLVSPNDRTPRLRWETTSTVPKPQPQPLSEPLLPLTSNTQNHHDLASFLRYATRTNLNPESKTYIGTHYEYTVLNSLRRLRLSLTRVGGPSDAGIDLLGQWYLPDEPSRRLRVLVQCKAYKGYVGPNVVRELEGTFAGAAVGWRGEGVVGMVVSPREATKAVRDALGRSNLPLVWVLVGLGGEVRQCLWNWKASEVGLDGVGVTVKYKPNDASHGGVQGENVKKEVVLTWKGGILEELGQEDGA